MPAIPVAAPSQLTSPGPGEATPRSRPGLSRKVLACAAAAVVVVAGGGFLLSRLPSTSGSSASTAAPSTAAPSTAQGPAVRAGPANAAAGSGITVISSGTDYRTGQLAAQVAAVMARYAAAAAGARVAVPTSQAASSQAASSQARQSGKIAALPACVARIAAGLRPTMVDEARYNGRAATIIVLPASRRELAQVWVVGPACSASHSDVITHMLLPGPG